MSVSFQVSSTLLSSVKYLSEPKMARDYVASRIDDASALWLELKGGKASYAKFEEVGGTFKVNGLTAKDSICAIAFLLARYW